MPSIPRLLWLLLSLGTALAEDSDVVVLTNSNWEELVRKSDSPWLVKFYAPWCGHCRALEPTWNEVSKKLKGRVNVGKVDITQEKWIAEDWDLTGFPTIKLLQKDKAYHYTGMRSPEAFESWAVEGYQASEGEVLPWDKPLHIRLFKSVVKPMTIYALPTAFGFALLFCMCMVCCEPSATPAERFKYEERRRLMELKAAQRKKAADGSAPEPPAEGAKETTEDVSEPAAKEHEPKPDEAKKED